MAPHPEMQEAVAPEFPLLFRSPVYHLPLRRRISLFSILSPAGKGSLIVVTWKSYLSVPYLLSSAVRAYTLEVRYANCLLIVRGSKEIQKMMMCDLNMTGD